MKKPTTLQEARALLESGQLREMVKLQIIVVAFADPSAVSLKALLELWAMPDVASDDWLDELSVPELSLLDDYLASLEAELKVVHTAD